MNWLAHIFLSDDHIEYQHGNLLADLLKGRSWRSAGTQFDAGLSMHRIIDSFTDGHPLVKRSKSRLGDNGYLKGVVIDIAYDHLLARNWHRYAHPSLEAFIDDFHRNSNPALAAYPDVAQRFLARLIETGHLRDYASFAGVDKAFRRIECRLSPRVLARERMLDYLPLLEKEISAIERDFLGFMPELIHHFKSVSGAKLDNHWLR